MIVFLILLYLTVLWTGPANAGTFSIHFASYKTLNQAEMDAGRLRSLGYAAFVDEAQVKNSGKWYRVYAGKYETRQKAAAAGMEMKRKKEIDKIFIHFLPGTKSEPAVKIARQPNLPMKLLPLQR